MSTITRELIVEILNSREVNQDTLVLLFSTYSKDKGIEEKYIEEVLGNIALLHRINMDRLLQHYKLKYNIISVEANGKPLLYY